MYPIFGLKFLNCPQPSFPEGTPTLKEVEYSHSSALKNYKN